MNGISIGFLWVPGYTGIPGNKKADNLTREAIWLGSDFDYLAQVKFNLLVKKDTFVSGSDTLMVCCPVFTKISSQHYPSDPGLHTSVSPPGH